MKQIKIYTDGGCSQKNFIGGWGALIIYPNGTEVELSGFFNNATNNQMELWGCIEALTYIYERENLGHVNIELVSDSEYVVNGITDWLPNWKRRGWKSKTGPVKNRPLWEALDDLVSRMPVKFVWTRGHNGDVNNERVDKLAVNAYKKELDKRNE